MQDTEILEGIEIPTILPYGRADMPALAEENALDILREREGYDISIMANDFNFFTLCNFLDRGMIVVPFFQRGFVWDQRKASRLIESIALGLPIPELFLYRAKSNDWWVVDGHQRVLSAYFFRKQRFPRPKAAPEISRLMRRSNQLPESKWNDDALFSDFALDLRSPDGGKQGGLHGKSYKDLEADIERRSMRAVVIRQHAPKGDDAAFDIFHRLNSGGVNLSQQQIRVCIYHSAFLDMIDELNVTPEWRGLFGQPLKKNGADAEVILRAFAMLEDGGKYGEAISGYKYGQSMRGFLNAFCRKKAGASAQDVEFLRKLFMGFLRACNGKSNMFHRKNKFSPALFESVFVASLRECVRRKKTPKGELKRGDIVALAKNGDFEEATRQSSNTKNKVRTRLDTAKRLINPL